MLRQVLSAVHVFSNPQTSFLSDLGMFPLFRERLLTDGLEIKTQASLTWHRRAARLVLVAPA